MRKSFLLIFCLFLFGAQAQVEISYAVKANIEANHFVVIGQIQMVLKNKGQKPIAKIPIEIWPNAYKKSGTFLAEERLEDQKTDLYFAKFKDLGFLDSLQLKTTCSNSSAVMVTQDSSCETYTLHLDFELRKDDSIVVETPFILKLPNAKYNGFGFSDFNLRLSQWFPKFSGYADSNFYPVYNSSLRYNYQNLSNIKATLNLPLDVDFVSAHTYELTQNKKTQTVHFNLKNVSDLPLLIFPKLYTLEVPQTFYKRAITTPKKIEIKYTQDLPPFDFVNGLNKITTFIKSELDLELPQQLKLVFLENKQAFKSSGNMLVLNEESKTEDIEAEIIEEYIQLVFSEKVNINSAQFPWMVNGMAHYYKTLYLRQNYPNKKYLGDLAQTKIGQFFEADEYPYEFRNIFLYHYMARQGLDQPLSDSAAAFPKFNYQAIVQGKTALSLDYLRSYTGDKNFKRSMHKFISDNTNQHATPQNFISAFKYYETKDLNWFLSDLYTTNLNYDYKLKNTKNCTYIYTATVKNKGQLVAPYSLTGIKDSTEVLTEWYDGHAGKKTVQMHLEDYDKVVLNYPGRLPEFNQKNNSVKTSGLFKNAKPLRLQLYTSFENPNKTQLFWLPNLKYNAYDQFLIGAQFYNTTLVRKPFEYRFSPDYSTGTGKLVGSGNIKFNLLPKKGPFHLVDFALYGRYYHYDKNLAYSRFSPTINFNFKKSSPRSSVLRTFRTRAVLVDRQTNPNQEIDGANLAETSYQVFDFKFTREYTDVIQPNEFNADLQLSDAFSKIQMDFTQRFRLGKNHSLGLRFFGGVFLSNKNKDQLNFYSFGLSGTQDYLFDYYFLGRSDISGIWSQQFFVSDGGFKSMTNVYDNNFMFTMSAQIPIYRYLKIFGDAGMTGQGNLNYFYDAGLALIIVPDFLEIYFPMVNNNGFFQDSQNYPGAIRYVLNLDISEIITRLRRGYY